MGVGRSNNGWTQVGTRVTVDSIDFPGILKFERVPGAQGQFDLHRVFKQLPSTLPVDAWIAEFEYKFSAGNNPTHFPFGLSSTSDDMTLLEPEDRVLVYHGGIGGNVLQLEPSGAALPGAIPISANTQYYITLERLPTQLILSVFSDPARTIHITNSPFIKTIELSDYSNINFIQHGASSNSGNARVLTAEVDNSVISGAVTQGGTIVEIGPGAYSVTEDSESGYIGTFSPDCSGNILAGQSKICVISNNDLDLTTGLVAHWKLDDNTGVQATDSSGNNNHGTLNNGPTWLSGSSCYDNNCLSFDGIDDHVSIPDSATLDGMQELTVSVWVKRNTVDGIQWVIGKSTQPFTFNSGSYDILLQSGEVRGRLYIQNTLATSFGGNYPTDTTDFHNIVLGYKGGLMTIHVDGERVGGVG